jgi:hypothetical protein
MRAAARDRARVERTPRVAALFMSLVVLASLATALIRVVGGVCAGRMTRIWCFLLIQLRFFALCDHQTARFRREFLALELDVPLSVAGRTGWQDALGEGGRF